jgi:type IV secretory pathway TraG/TraD family ATPase VirD4
MSVTITLAELALTGVGSAAVPVVWRKGGHTLGAVCAAGSLALGYHISPVVDVAVLAASGAYGYHWWHHTATHVTQAGRRLRRKHGVASTWDVARHGSWLAAHHRAEVIRPSLAGLPWWRPSWTVPTRELAVPLCRTGWLRVWSSIELVVLKIGAPRSGKSGSLACDILDAPGAVIATSTRTDLHDTTAGLRARRGPVMVFNPSGLGSLPSTVGFSPLLGCGDPTVAAYRAADMIAAASRGGEHGDRAHWEAQARRVLTALLHAAAIGGRDMTAVARWTAVQNDTTRDEVLGLLKQSPAAAGYVPDARQFFTTNDRTRTSITSTISPCLSWLTSPAAVAATTGPPLDVAGFLRERGSLYLLGSEEAHTAPLVAALTGHIAREARRIAATCPGGRLDPPLTMALDEAALICPVPLDRWAADMGGRGVHIIAAFQSRAQILGRWGDTAGRAILANAGAVVLFTQGHDVDDLTHWAKLAGDRDEPTTARNPAGEPVSQGERKTKVLSPAQLTMLRPGRVVVFRVGMHPVLGRTQMAWQRADVQTHQRETARAARAVVAEAARTAQQAAQQTTQSPTLAPASPAAAPTSPTAAPGTPGRRVFGWVTHRPRRGPSPTGAPAAATTAPVPGGRWVVDTRRVTQPANGRSTGTQPRLDGGDRGQR